MRSGSQFPLSFVSIVSQKRLHFVVSITLVKFKNILRFFYFLTHIISVFARDSARMNVGYHGKE